MMSIPVDQAARDRIASDLSTNLIVEAGAGSGKTTSLVQRMVQHVRSGTPVQRLAAVTFTRKGANELRERFRNELEAVLRSEAITAEARARVAMALRDMDQAFLGTIHAFCGRILREHPLQAGVDPTFQEVSGDQMKLLEQHFWRRWVDREEHSENSALRDVRQVGIDPASLFDGFRKVRQYPDVTFEREVRPLPDLEACRTELDSLLADAMRFMPPTVPEGGWDPLMQTVRRLNRSRRVDDWDRHIDFCRALSAITATGCEVTQKRWGSTPESKSASKALSERFTTFVGTTATSLLTAWYEHRYPLAMGVLQEATEAFERERLRSGQLGFEDLLMLTATLLRNHPEVRDDLGGRFAHLLVDEFQDTDPVQAEVCLLLASPSSEGTDWRTVVPRPGSLFVVGDPKQSIYRFRRADIEVYEFVKHRIAATGDVLSLTANFRSARQIGDAVNEHFSSAFGTSATAEQAAFSQMYTMGTKDGAVLRYEFEMAKKCSKEAIFAKDAELVASHIATAIASGGMHAGDFLILTRDKRPVAHYARELSRRNIPVSTTGAGLSQEHELGELIAVLRAIADPENAVCAVAALEGLFFGLSPAELWRARQAGFRFSITKRPADLQSPSGQALMQLYEWWILSQREPADVLIERILDDTGLIFHAAGQELGSARAGALLHIVDTLRSASSSGASSVMDAIEHIEALLQDAEDDVSLLPGRSDSVRVMNVHQAKGLEAEVVILAAPVDQKLYEPDVHIRRSSTGSALGSMCIGYKANNVWTTLAQCPDWAAFQSAEARFEEAEAKRLLYVAVTRAKNRLLVAQMSRVSAAKKREEPAPDRSVWRPLAPMLERCSTAVGLEIGSPPAPRSVTNSAPAIRQSIEQARLAVEAARTASRVVQTVTQSAKTLDNAVPLPRRSSVEGKGTAWGSAVHRVIEGYLRGRRGDGLTSFARAVSREEQLSEALDAELLAFAAGADGAAWLSAIPAGSQRFAELTVMQCVAGEDVDVITEGVIDAVALQDNVWTIVDWKTDSVDDAEWSARHEAYQRQVSRYGAMLSGLTGLPANVHVQRLPS